MIVELAEAQAHTAKADVCIVGSGAAGITLALELAKTALNVVVIESGGDSAEHTRRSIYKVAPGKKIRLANDETRPSYFGGNTNYWYGNCRPLEKEDFDQREWLPYSGWPFGLQELKPYYERALEVAGVGGFHLYNPETVGPLLPGRIPPSVESVIETRIDQTTPRFKFSDRYRQILASSENVRVLLGTHVLRLKTNSAADRIVAAEALGWQGGGSSIHADTFVLAAGGVENARLLLCSNDTSPAGLGNQSDLVGRFFMDHLYFAFEASELGLDGEQKLRRLRLYNQGSNGDRDAALRHHRRIEGTRVFPKLSMSAGWMERERVPGLNLWIRPARFAPRGIKALQRIIAGLKKARLPGLSTVREVPSSPLRSLRFLLWKLTGRFRFLPDLELVVQIEQKPDPHNRIRLSTDLDQFGQPRPELEMALDDEQRRQHASSLAAAANELGFDGGKLASVMERKYHDGEFDFIWHHMGTTRMSVDPEQGVVDQDCRVHGLANLFVAGSSVFPTSGTAPPTLTVIALAIRLADRIKQTVHGSSAAFGSRDSIEQPG